MFSEHVRSIPVGQYRPRSTEGSNDSLLRIENEIVTPEQFFVYARSSAVSWTGERRLLLAVLEDAIANFLRYMSPTGRRNARLFREECEWFWSTERRHLYAFETICDYLSLDADYIRSGLRRVHTRT